MKTTHLIRISILTLLFQTAFAQNERKESKPLNVECGCPQAMEQTIDKVTRIYAGFDDKVTVSTRPAYDKVLKDVRARAPKAKTEG